jgi:hypothetical protein
MKPSEIDRFRSGAAAAELSERAVPPPRWPDGSEWLPSRLPLRVWLCAIAAFIAAYGTMWSIVHVRADTRPCLVHLPDPFFDLIPYDRSWYYVSHDVYFVFTAGAVIGLLYQAVRGDHRGIVRWGTALTFQAIMRSITITLLPICRITVAPGTIALKEIPTLDLGFFEIPWRVWASNDLIFSGHVGEFLLLYWATRSWPAKVRVLLVLFQLLQAYALLATRGHYAIDLLIAIPCAYLADGLAMRCLVWLARPSVEPAPST